MAGERGCRISHASLPASFSWRPSCRRKAPSAKKKLRSNAQKIAETDNGRLDLVSNELLLSAVDVDPPKMRLHARAEQLIKGAYTWATQRQDGKYEEVAMLVGKQDERVRENPYDFTGAIEFFIRKWVQGTPDDSQFRRQLTILSDGVWFDALDEHTRGDIAPSRSDAQSRRTSSSDTTTNAIEVTTRIAPATHDA